MYLVYARQITGWVKRAAGRYDSNSNRNLLTHPSSIVDSFILHLLSFKVQNDIDQGGSNSYFSALDNRPSQDSSCSAVSSSSTPPLWRPFRSACGTTMMPAISFRRFSLMSWWTPSLWSPAPLRPSPAVPLHPSPGGPPPPRSVRPPPPHSFRLPPLRSVGPPPPRSFHPPAAPLRPSPAAPLRPSPAAPLLPSPAAPLCPSPGRPASSVPRRPAPSQCRRLAEVMPRHNAGRGVSAVRSRILRPRPGLHRRPSESGAALPLGANPLLV